MIFIRNKYLQLLFGLLILPYSLSATHIIGGEILYKCLGNEEYEFTMKIYRDCQNGIPCFDSSTDCLSAITLDGTVTIFDGNKVFRALLLSEPEILKIEPNISNPCLRPPSGVCVEEGKYIFKFRLPPSENSYTISYQRCCRNETIENIRTPGMVGATYTTLITPAAQLACNSSPEFNSFPPIIICNGVDVDFDHSATDVDGDSVVYSLCTPYIGGGTSGQDPGGPLGVAPDPETPPPYEEVTYERGYSFFNPIQANRPGVRINKVTGLLSGVPTLLGQFVVSICAKSYKDTVLMNEIRRDFQFNVGDCVPTVDAAIKDATIIQRNGQEIFTIKQCGEQGNLFNESTRPGDIRFQDWLFPLASGNLSSLEWDFRNITFPDKGIYNGTLILNDGLPCNDTAFIEVEVLPGLEANFSYAYDTCSIEPIDFTDLSSSEISPSAITQWIWDMGNGDTLYEQEFSYQYDTSGAFPVTLTIRDINDCEVNYEETVSYFPLPKIVSLAPTTKQGCIPLSANFNNLSTLLSDDYTILWDFGDGGTGMGLIPDYIYEQAGVYDIFVDITSPVGCQIDTLWEDLITVLASPIANFSFTPPIVTNIDGAVQFTDESIGTSFLIWEFDNRATSEEAMPTFEFNEPGIHPVLLTVTAANGCTDTLTRFVEVLPEIRYTLPNAFTPNQDGKNDFFFGKGNIEDATDFHFSIWNRYGEQIFETMNPQEGWNGKKNNIGKPAPAGVYVAVATYKNFRGQLFTVRGHVSLIR